MKDQVLYPEAIAHRGAGSVAPENTLAALRMAYTYGINAVEFDVMLAKDGIAMLNHDKRLGRTIAGTGEFTDYTSFELQQLDAGGWHSRQFLSEPVPLFKDVLDFCVKHHIWMNIEIKPYPGYEVQTGRVVAQMVVDRFFSEPVPTMLVFPVLSSFSFDALQEAKKVDERLALGMLWEHLPDNWEVIVSELGCMSVHLNHQYLTQSQIKCIKNKNLKLLCYTVNDKKVADKLMKSGVDAIFSDDLRLLDVIKSKT